MSSPIAPDVVRHLKTVSDPSLSPDGSRLAFVLSRVDRDTWEPRSRIMMAWPATGETGEFTQGTHDSLPRFSPDGASLAFLRGEAPGRRQVWIMGTGGGEARRLTQAPGGVIDFAWSPDSRRIAYCADVDPDVAGDAKTSSDPGVSGGPGAGGPRVSVVTRIRYRYDTLGWRGNAHFHLFVTDVSGGPDLQLTDLQLTEGDWDDLAPVWSPDGSRVAFISGRGEDRDIRALSQVYVAPSSGGEPVLWSQGLGSAAAVAWSPDGQKLVAAGSDRPEGLELWQSWLYVLEPGKPPQRLTDDSFRPYLAFPAVGRPSEMRWTGDGRVLLLGEAQGESFLFQVPASGGPAIKLHGGNCQSSALGLDATAGGAVLLSSSPDSPGDLHYVDISPETASEASSRTAKQLTDYNRAYLEEHPPAAMEKFTIERAGLGIECRLFFPGGPEGFDPSRRYPLVLDIHGGPNGAFYDSFVTWQQVLATSGYLVLAVNPRGSSTYGNDFMLAVLEDWGGEDYLDLMAATDRVIERPYVDASRLGVHGYSYGGYMTSWIVGHTNRFRAAVVGAPCINLVSMYGTSDIGVSFGEVQWGGSSLEAAQKLAQRSPLTYAAQVDTPALLLHGEADARCPIGQSEEFFVALKRLGKEVELARFPDCSHLFPRLGHPKMREEYLSRTLDWFNRRLA